MRRFLFAASGLSLFLSRDVTRVYISHYSCVSIYKEIDIDEGQPFRMNSTTTI